MVLEVDLWHLVLLFLKHRDQNHQLPCCQTPSCVSHQTPTGLPVGGEVREIPV